MNNKDIGNVGKADRRVWQAQCAAGRTGRGAAQIEDVL